MNQNYTYLDAFNELQTIVRDIETAEVSVDDLADKIQRASLLINICKTKLTDSEEKVDKLLSQLTEQTNQENTEEE